MTGTRSISGAVAVTLGLVLAASPAVAQDAETLRRELEQLRRSFQEMQQKQQQAIDALTDRLRRLEAQPQPVTAQPPTAPATTAPPAVAPTAPAPVAQTPGGFQTGPLTPMDILRPRQPFGLYQQRGAGQLLFDMGVTGDFVGNLVNKKLERTQLGTFAGRENRFFPREVELNLFGQIDPFARADVRIEAGEEERGAATRVSLAEATITLLTLPYGTQAKFGQLRNRFGWSNAIHEHDLPWVDRPDVYRIFLGEEGLVEKGLEATWVPDFLPVYLEVLGGVFTSDNETAFGGGRLSHPLVTGRARAYFDLSDTSAIQLGTSVASGDTTDNLRNTLLGYDVKYKYRPDGWLHPLLTLGSEGIYSIRRVSRSTDTTGLVDTDGDGVADTEVTTSSVSRRTLHRFGFYGWGEVQPWRRWAFGLRYDRTQYPVDPGYQWAIEPYLSFFPSEFLRFRLGFKHTERSRDTVFDPDGPRARVGNELFLQGTFILGAHPAHQF